MDIPLFIRQRLDERKLDQKDLAAAAGVTESYISQLLARKKLPPAPGKTRIYGKMERFLQLPPGRLGKLAEGQRLLEWKKKVAPPPPALAAACRKIVLRKCRPALREEVGRIFEKEPFGELERLVTRTLAIAVQSTLRQNSRQPGWLAQLAKRSSTTAAQLRAALPALLEPVPVPLPGEASRLFLEPLVESWTVDLNSFEIDIELDLALAHGARHRYAMAKLPPPVAEPGFLQFAADPTLSGDATPAEMEFLASLRLAGRRPTALYFYRELQNLRDPLHFTI